jgi:hypothetical protein
MWYLFLAWAGPQKQESGSFFTIVFRPGNPYRYPRHFRGSLRCLGTEPQPSST